LGLRVFLFITAHARLHSRYIVSHLNYNIFQDRAVFSTDAIL